MFTIKFNDAQDNKTISDEDANGGEISEIFGPKAVAFADGGWDVELHDTDALINAMDPHGRVLVWANLEDSDNDDGSKAIAAITHKYEFFARERKDGDFDIIDTDGGDAITVIHFGPTVWPVGSDLSAGYEHPKGIVLDENDVKKLGLEIE